MNEPIKRIEVILDTHSIECGTRNVNDTLIMQASLNSKTLYLDLKVLGSGEINTFLEYEDVKRLREFLNQLPL